MQRSFDDLGTPLHQVTFCVLDLETTGASPPESAITEVGAIKLRGGECLGTFQTLVNPGVGIPPEITVLTGITHAMVLPAPRIEAVLPAFLEFLGAAVIVGHNVRFDLRFLQAALVQSGHRPVPNLWVDTCALARRLVRDEVPNCRLGTLAERLRLPHRPTHRALDDALATGDLLHALLERAGSLGVLGLDDLFELPTVRAHPQVAKLRLTAGLPRRPGVYLFRGSGGRVLYVGKATNLRARVRSYFGGDERRKVAQLLRETVAIDHVVCPGTLEAAVLEVRLIHRHLPPFNRRSKLWNRYAYVKLTLDEPFPRLSVVRAPREGDGCLYLGPLASPGAARLVADAIESALPLRRCTARVPKVPKAGACAPAQLGVSSCPCAGTVSPQEYAAIVDRVVAGLTEDPAILLDPLAARMEGLAEAERYEEAADMRDRAAALARALARQRQLDALRRAGRLEIEVAGEPGGPADARRRLVLTAGRLPSGAAPRGGTDAQLPLPDGGGEDAADPDQPLPRHLVDELVCVASWLDAEARRVRLVHCEGPWAVPVGRLPRFEPVRATARRPTGSRS
ncbi:MAG TPA: DEDD exonuclease domain-containing protein [Acidimicrobiales bacterium]|nr:DEDD exonuclease domain-containing protein [Acidimicrobiales bacterium]